ncbi:hypothetical protein M758_UG226000 [Ceratodon purpureus]|nr:hypothetical protein M758_UG226000 [Ceratodon purpureus]
MSSSLVGVEEPSLKISMAVAGLTPSSFSFKWLVLGLSIIFYLPKLRFLGLRRD